MPGIFGIISKRPKEINLNELNLMADSVHMEEHFQKGSFCLIERGIYVSWTCHRNSFSDCLPIINEKQDCTLIFVGENFHDPEDLDELKKRNHKYDRKNASYLIHMYEEWGENFFEMLNGHFHGLVIDKRTENIILFNDRFGIHRIYYLEAKDAFYFAYEAKAILRLFYSEVNIQQESLAELFAFNCVLDNRSLFSNIFILPGGSSWKFNENGNIKKNLYFRPSNLEALTLLESEFHYEKLLYTLQKSLKRYFRAEEKAGIYLEDSIYVRIILANAMYGIDKVPCYMLAGEGVDADCLRFASSITSTTGLPLHVIKLNHSFLDRFHEFALKTIEISEGNIDIKSAIKLYFFSIAKEIAQVHIYCEHGAAILRRKQLINLNKYSLEIFDEAFRLLIYKAIERYIELLPAGLTKCLAKTIPLWNIGEISLLQSQVVVRSPFIDNDIVELMFRAIDEVANNDKVSIRLINDGNPKFGFKKNIKSYSLLMQLFRLVKKFKVDSRKDIYNHSHFGKIYLPESLFRKQAETYAREIISNEKAISRDYLNKYFIRKMIEEEKTNKHKYSNEIISVASIEILRSILK